MRIEVTEADQETVDKWDSYVEQSSQGTPFHRYQFLTVLEQFSGMELHPLIGWKGEEPTGIFPVFAGSAGPFTVAFSPPPGQGMFQLGPVLLNVRSVKQRKREKRTKRFVEGCLNWLSTELSPKYVHLRTHHGYDALRPFVWNGFDASPRFTYHIDLTADEETILMRFSKDARRNIRRMEEDPRVQVREGGAPATERTIEHVRERHDDQNREYPISAEYVATLYEVLPDGQVRAYVCTVDGEFATGTVTIEAGDTIYGWQGGARPLTDRPVNEFVEWRILQAAKERGRTTYDFVGANVEQLCSYKAKFNPTLREYHVLVGGRWWMRNVVDFYRQFKT
jgi:predicted N-acyltransferase